MSRLWMIPLALLIVLASHAYFVLAAPAPVIKRPQVEVVICLDTTGSMSIIEPAKTKIWTLINLIQSGKPSPELRMGLVAFKDKGDEYVTKVFDLRDDLDEVLAEFRTYSANGGGDTPESVNQALDDAVNKINWSADRKVLKFIYLVGDAPPHMDYPDDVKYPVTCKKAKERGIIINTIRTGSDADCEKYWKEISELTGGLYGSINADGSIRAISTPQDRDLVEVNRALLKTAIVYGDATKRERDSRKLDAAMALTGDAPADRACWMAREGKISPSDLIDSIRAEKLKLGSLKSDDLPLDLSRLTLQQRADYLDKVQQDRAKLFRTALDLERKRTEALVREALRNTNSFDGLIFDMFRKQTARRIRY